MDGPDAAEPNEWHRRFGASLFNRAWALIERTGRSDDDDAELFLAAAASRWHWGQVGGPEQLAAGDWQVAHVASLLGFADVALTFARRNLAIAESEKWDGWRLASAHEGMARAFAAAGDAGGRQRHVAAARAALEREPDPADREVIVDQLATVPEL